MGKMSNAAYIRAAPYNTLWGIKTHQNTSLPKLKVAVFDKLK